MRGSEGGGGVHAQLRLQSPSACTHPWALLGLADGEPDRVLDGLAVSVGVAEWLGDPVGVDVGVQVGVEDGVTVGVDAATGGSRGKDVEEGGGTPALHRSHSLSSLPP